MALSGSVSTSKYDGRYLKLSWTATQSVANNTSTIKWTLSAAGGNYNWYSTGPVTCTIDGSTVYSRSSRTDMYKGTIASGTKTITHNSDGTRTFKVTIRAAIYYYDVNCTGSSTFTLNPIDRVPGAPTSVTCTAGNGSYVSIGDTATIRWSGTTGTLTGYQWQYQWAGGDWSSTRTVTTTSSSGSATEGVTSSTKNAGEAIRFRVRAMNGSLASGWAYSSYLTVVGGMRVKASGSWKQGLAFVKVNGAWKTATHVYVKVNGTWKESI